MYFKNKHNNKIQIVDLTLYNRITRAEILEVLTVKKLLKSYFILKMNRLVLITSKNAQLLISSKFDEIQLQSLKKGSNKTLGYLSKMKAAIEIGLTSLNTEQASILSQNSAALTFSNLKSISSDVALVLSQFKGNILELPALQRISNNALLNLCQFQGEFMLINKARLTKKQLIILKSYKGKVY
jgi:hypothetical protein